MIIFRVRNYAVMKAGAIGLLKKFPSGTGETQKEKDLNFSSFSMYLVSGLKKPPFIFDL